MFRIAHFLVDPDDRLSGLYVDWTAGECEHGIAVNPEVLASPIGEWLTQTDGDG